MACLGTSGLARDVAADGLPVGALVPSVLAALPVAAVAGRGDEAVAARPAALERAVCVVRAEAPTALRGVASARGAPRAVEGRATVAAGVAVGAVASFFGLRMLAGAGATGRARDGRARRPAASSSLPESSDADDDASSEDDPNVEDELESAPAPVRDSCAVRRVVFDFFFFAWWTARAPESSKNRRARCSSRSR